MSILIRLISRYDGCIGGCDETLNDLLQLNNQKSPTATTSSQRSTHTRPATTTTFSQQPPANTQTFAPPPRPNAVPLRTLVAPTSHQNRVPVSSSFEGQAVVCSCGLEAAKRTVMKQSANHGTQCKLPRAIRIKTLGFQIKFV